MKTSKKKKEKVALMCTSLHQMAGGLEKQIILTSQSIKESGYQTYLISFDSEGDESFFKIPEGVTWLKCGCGLKPHKRASITNRIKQLIYLRKVVRRNKIECLITFHHGLYIRSLAATLCTAIKNIVSERNSLQFYNYIRQRKNNLAYLLSHFASARTVQVSSYKNEYPVWCQKRIHVIPNIINIRRESYSRPKLESRKVIMVGRIESQKNHSALLDQMMQSMEKVKGLDFEVTIAGEGSLKEIYEKKYKALMVNGHLTFLGNTKNISELLDSGAVFCFPSLWEGYPNALVEALCAGLPIVTTHRMVQLNEFVEQGVNGDIVDDGKLYDAIESLLSDKDRLNKYSSSSFSKYKVMCGTEAGKLWAQLIE